MQFIVNVGSSPHNKPYIVIARIEVLPFHSARGGKHCLCIGREKYALEHIQDRQEMYQIIDMASSLACVH